MAEKIKDSIFKICLFLLVFEYGVSKIYIVQNMPILLEVLNVLEIPVYVALVYVILKKEYERKQILGIGIVGVILLIGYTQSGMMAYLRALFLIIAAKDISYKKILQVCRWAMTSSFVLALVLYLAGISDSGVHRRDSIALGYVHPNQAAQVLLVILLLYLTEKSFMWKIKDYVIVGFVSILIYIVLNSRTTVLVLLMTPVLIEIFKRVFDKSDKMRNCFIVISKFSQFGVFLFTLISAVLLPKIEWLNKLDVLFSNRIFLNYYGLSKYGITLFGQNVNLIDTDGAYNSMRDVFYPQTTVDNSYMISLLIMGLIPTVIFLVGFYLIISKAEKNNNYVIMVICIMMAVYAFSESQMVEIYNNFVFLYIMAFDDLNNKKNGVEKIQVDSDFNKNMIGD